ncbi:methyltransferase [Chloroflexota bacterium]
MNCCHCEGAEVVFDRKGADKKLKKFRRKGARRTTNVLVEALKIQGVQGASLLDIGGGIGAIQHQLLNMGVERTTNLEASSGYIEACKEEAERLGHGGRITHMHGDFADMQGVPSADIITMDRVICCYPDYEGLVNQACKKSKKLLGLVFPLDNWLVRLVLEVFLNLPLKLQGNPFRVFAHPTQAIEAIIIGQGFERRFYKLVGTWQVIVYQRPD